MSPKLTENRHKFRSTRNNGVLGETGAPQPQGVGRNSSNRRIRAQEARTVRSTFLKIRGTGPNP